MSPERWEVHVVETATNEVVKRIACPGQHTAEKVERGLNINLNHERFFTNIVLLAPEKPK